MTWLALFLLLLAPPGEAQKTVKRKTATKKIPPATSTIPTTWPIESIKIEGNRLYTADQIVAVAALKLGQLAGKDDFEAARNRLLETGAFGRVGYRFAPAPSGKGYRATFEVVEVQQVLDYYFADLPASTEELRARVKKANPLSDARIPMTQQVLERTARALQEFLVMRGFKDKVVGKMTPQGDTFVVVFRPSTPPPSVAEVRFTGNQVLPTTALRNAIAGVAVGTVYDEKYFRQLLDTSVRPLYDGRGRIRVAFSKVGTEKARDVNGVVVTVEVNEGPSYNLGEVHVEGVAGDTGGLYRAADFKSGDLADFQQIDAGIERIHKRLRRIGYMKATSRTERKIDDKKRTVDLIVRLEPGPQFVFGKLAIEGLDIIGEAGIKKLWAPKEGQPFDGDYPDYFLERVRQDGVFENLGKTRSLIKLDEENRTVDVTLIFRGGK